MIEKGMVSIILLNWNGKRFLEECLGSIFRQSYPKVELIVIDNCSTDNSKDIIRHFQKQYNYINFVENETNIGFSKAMNFGIDMSRGEYVLLCNFDIKLSTNYVYEVAKAIERGDEIGSVSGKLLSWGNAEGQTTIDSTGIFLDFFRTPLERGQREIDKGQYNKSGDIFCPSGALPLYRKKMLMDIKLDNEYFDNDFFAYYEDIDLGWRAQLMGWRSIYCPTAIAFHFRGGASKIRGYPDKTKALTAQKEAIKNRYLMLIKNEDCSNLLIHSSFIFPYEILRFLYIVIKYPKVLKNLFILWRLIPRALKKRRLIQFRRKMGASHIRSFIFPRGKKFANNSPQTRRIEELSL